MITSMMRRALLSGDGSTLSLDFTTGVLDSRLTFTRGSGTNISGTGPSFIGSNGYVQYAGTNVPRFDYDPSTLAIRGLLMESQATNLLTQSNDLTTGWTWTHIVDLTGMSSPDNSNNATLWEATSGNATIIRTAAVGTSAQRTFSFWAKRDTGSGNFQYTLDNGGTWTTLAITSSWVRYVIAATTANHQVGFRIQTHGDIVGIWGCQLEDGSGASSYIPTGGSTATRNEDSATMSSVASLGFDQYQGTFIVRGVQNKQGAFFARLLRIAGASTEPFGMPVNGVTLYGTSRNSSNASISEATRTNTLGQSFAFGMSLDANDAAAAMKVSLNGSGTSATRTAVGPTQAAATLSFNTNATSTNYGCFAVRSVKFFPVTKTLAELNALTT